MAWSLVFLAQLRGNLPATLALCALLGARASLHGHPRPDHDYRNISPRPMHGKVLDLQNNLINMALSLPLVLAAGIVGRYGLVSFSACSLS